MFGLIYITDPKIREFYYGKDEKQTKKEQSEKSKNSDKTSFRR